MARRGASIAVKMIGISTVLLVVVIGLFGVLSRMQARRIIDDSTKRLENKITDSLRRAGAGQLRLLGETTRIALLQSDYSTLQTIVQNIKANDTRVTEIAVINQSGTILAHNNAKMTAKKAEGALHMSTASKKLMVQSGVKAGGQRSIAFMMPVRHEGTTLCSVFLAYTLKPLEEELAKAAAIKKRELGSSLKNVLVVGLLAVLLGVLLNIIQSLQISRPIKALAAQAARIAGGDLDARVEVKTRDEVGELGDRFNYMAEQVVALMQEAMDKVVMEKELEVVSAVQSTLVPDSSVVDLNGLSLAGYFKPATQCGGDWWNYYQLEDGRILVIIGDVTGHGAASAMITAAAKGSATTITHVSGSGMELPVLLKAMNRAINDAAKGRFVMTCFASIYDPETRTMWYANAGHNFPYIYEGKKLQPLVARGNRLGDVIGSEFEVRQLTVNPGTLMIWYTDGIVEGEDAKGEEYGERRFRKRIKEYSELNPEQVRDELVARAFEFFGDVPPKDDITMVIGRFT